MKIYIEENQKFGKGYQLRVDSEELADVVDIRAYDLLRAIRMGSEVLGIANKRLGTAETLRNVLVYKMSAVKANASWDFHSARTYRAWREAGFADGDEVTYAALRSRRKMPIAELVVESLYGWREAGDPEGQAEVRRFCEYVCSQGYPSTAERAMDDLEGMSAEEAEAWVGRTCLRYAKNEPSIFAYVFGVDNMT